MKQKKMKENTKLSGFFSNTKTETDKLSRNSMMLAYESINLIFI